ncbi:MAG: hypothetical protein MRERV_35c046, partial [Mycoplasmataceae bacterium RV_VA103A]
MFFHYSLIFLIFLLSSTKKSVLLNNQLLYAKLFSGFALTAKNKS